MFDLDDLKTEIAQFTGDDGLHATDIPGLTLIRMSRPTEPAHNLVHPAVVIVAQGSKRTVAGDRVLTYDASSFLVISADTPITFKRLGRRARDQLEPHPAERDDVRRLHGAHRHDRERTGVVARPLLPRGRVRSARRLRI